MASVAPGGFEGLEGLAAIDPRDSERIGTDEPIGGDARRARGPDGPGGSPGIQEVRSTACGERIPVLQLRRADWDRDVPGLDKGSRLGRIFTATADRRAIDLLAADPDVISVEASRGGGLADCARSMPWIGAPLARAAPSTLR